MKKWLSIIGAIGLTATSTTTLISCKKENNNENGGEDNKPEPQYNPQQPPEGSNWKQVIAQDKPFNTVDNKWYFVVWRGDENDNWRIIKFPNINFSEKRKVLDTQEDYELALTRVGDNLFRIKIGAVRPVTSWSQDDGTYFKSVYRWDGVDEPEIPTINKNTGEITDWKEQKGTS
ncbi:lipoprotein [Spiroplasma phoeniceum]|uniref:Spiroplasma plectrovirus-related protein n=1 Tax=Spiroplasma phoeniceum P40 TaxID=1276259 RepID=A0A345DNH6_9MOLU|nr:lipoprotein [Spiroplasma phoeniceum]AXF95764.1 hypothetical protein SDAV_00779 [Spiroplasma phoeniceum P40]